MDGESILDFGTHKGKKLKDVPMSWFTRMYDMNNKKMTGELLQYAVDTIGSIRYSEEKKKKGNGKSK